MAMVEIYYLIFGSLEERTTEQSKIVSMASLLRNKNVEN